MRVWPWQWNKLVIFGLISSLATISFASCQLNPSVQATTVRSTAVPPATTPSSNSQLTTSAASASDSVGTAQSGSWNQLGGNPQRTAYVDANFPALSGGMNQTWRVRWIWNGPAGIDTGPAADHLALPKGADPVFGGGRFYVGHTDGNVRAVSTQNGQLLWTRQVGGQLLNVGAYDPATDAVFFASTNGRIFKLRASDGQVVGDFNAGSEIRQAPLLVGDTIYIGTMGGTLYALNTQNLTSRWNYAAGAAMLASAAYANKNGGLIIFPSEDKFVHAVRTSNGSRAWRVEVNAGQDPQRENRRFPDTFPVVSEANDAVIIRSYYNWGLTWLPNGGAPDAQDGIRQFINQNPQQESLFVLDLDDGSKRFVAPVLGGGIGNNDDYYSTPPQAVVRRLSDGSEVAYLFWRTRVACLPGITCDGREDTTIGEMNLQTGAIRFVRDWKNQGTMRFPTDEQGALSMAGNVLFHSHWMSMGSIRIPDRTSGGSSISNPIPSEEYLSVSNTLAASSCPNRLSQQRFCPNGHKPPGDGYQLDAGFYIYMSGQNVYDQFFTPSVRGVVISDNVVYWKSVDGAIIALSTDGSQPQPTTPPGSATATPRPGTPTVGPGPVRGRVFLPLIIGRSR
ncbi:MAG: PQQ-binding-like beta-propeller repeat protein [Chloroflexaceae bacterium]|jgi:outer membrane protein assembly factor BamB|nr:PQQ-binding-like beta-propeller repeat protein [Chloroflexaceae bacterium]